MVVFGRSEGRRERVVLDTLPYSSYRVRHEPHTDKEYLLHRNLIIDYM